MIQKKTCRVRQIELGDGTPRICIPLTAGAEDTLKDALVMLSDEPFDLVEWRADFYENIRDGAAMRRALHLIRTAIGDRPLLFTLRTASEGGAFAGPFEEYAALCECAGAAAETDLVDIQLEGTGDLAGQETERAVRGLIARLHGMGKAVIASSHDFEKTPPAQEIVRRLCKMQDMDADIGKIAVMPCSAMDVVRLLEASVQMKETMADRPFVTMSMGSLGQVSRIAGGLNGSCITFGTAGSESAPGQLPAHTLEHILRALGTPAET